MNVIVKSAVAGALALAASGAFALGVPSTGSSDLVLIVQNNSTPTHVYALDTGISIDSVMSSSVGTYVSGAVLNSTAFTGLNKVISGSTTLQSFLAANPASGDGFTIEAGENATGGGSINNNTTKPVGAASMIISTANGTITPGNVSAKQLINLNGFLNGLQSDVSFGDLSTLNGPPVTTENDTTVGYSAAAAGKYNFFGANDLQALGTTQDLFGFTGNGGTGKLQSYELGTVSLGSDGTLTFKANAGTVTPPAVPLPAAVWLFGSGVLGLIGVSRRRKTAVVA